MSLRVTTKVEGLRELDAALGEFKKPTARAILRRTLLKAADPMVEMASRLAPDDPATGAPDLHSTIIASSRVRNTIGNAEFSAVLSGGGTRAEARAALIDARRAAGEGSFAEVYVGPAAGSKRNAIKAIVQEFGSVNQAAQPYMRPAWEATKQQILDSIKGLLKIEIDKAIARAAAKALRLAAKG